MKRTRCGASDYVGRTCVRLPADRADAYAGTVRFGADKRKLDIVTTTSRDVYAQAATAGPQTKLVSTRCNYPRTSLDCGRFHEHRGCALVVDTTRLAGRLRPKCIAACNGSRVEAVVPC